MTANAKDRHVAWCVHGRRARCCAKRFECHRLEKEEGIVRAVSARQCNEGCDDRVAPHTERGGRAMKIAAVITAHNEGEEVRRTVESLAASVTEAQLLVIVVDDGSTDGSCDTISDWASGKVDLLVPHHEKPQGVGLSRNAGWELAQRFAADVVTFHDAHMRFPQGGLETLARRALEAGTIVCAGSRGLTEGSQRLWGCDLFYNAKDGLGVKWRDLKPPAEEWSPSPCMMGAGYVMSAATARRLEAATGQLWEDTAGRWGFSEQALSVKAWLLGIGVEFSRDVIINHLYRDVNPVADAGSQLRRNACRSMYVLLGPDQFDLRFRAICERWLGRKVVEEIVDGLPTFVHRAPWERCTNGRVFEWLCGRRSAITQVHPDNAWLKDVMDACLDLAQEHPGGEGVRVLQWRPGEATFLVRELLPHAEICAVELAGHRAENWAHLAKSLRVTLERTPPTRRYWEVVGQSKAFRAEEGFDLVLVNGEAQEQCLRVARKVVKDGGGIIYATRADRGQIHPDFVKMEREALTKAGWAWSDDGPATPPATAGTHAEVGAPGGEPPGSGAAGAPASDIPVGPASSPDRDPLVTVCLLNWKRPHHLPKILDCLARQTVPVVVFIWNNGKPLPLEVTAHPLVKLVVDASANLGCFPRWWLASRATTEFVCSMDDDLLLKDERVLEDAVAACKRKSPDIIVGLFGWTAIEGRHYHHGSQHVNGSREDRWVDVIKGRFMLFRRALLDRVPLWPQLAGPDTEEVLHRCDDIYLSYCISGGRPGWHLVPGVLGKRRVDLPQGGVGLAAQPGHYDHRDRAAKAIRAWAKSQSQSKSET